eukprot:480926-Pleurochrysis_carterae.AAC.2
MGILLYYVECADAMAVASIVGRKARHLTPEEVNPASPLPLGDLQIKRVTAHLLSTRPALAPDIGARAQNNDGKLRFSVSDFCWPVQAYQ